MALSCIVCEILRVIGQKSRNFYTPPVFSVPTRGDPIGMSRRYLILIQLEWLGYRIVKKLWQYIKPFWYNSGQTDRLTDRIPISTSVSETIRKPPLVKAQTALRKQKKIKYDEKRFSIWRMAFLHLAMWHDHDIDFARWQHPAMWHVALGSWQWIHQVAAAWNVTRGSGMTYHWIRPNVRHIGILLLVSISTISPQSTWHAAPVCEIFIQIGPPSAEKIVMSIFNMADLRHLGFLGSSNGFIETPMYDFL